MSAHMRTARREDATDDGSSLFLHFLDANPLS